MNNLKIIKWIISLQEKDRALAIVLVAVCVLWVQNLLDKKRYSDLQDKFRIELVQRDDTCKIEKLRIRESYDEKIKGIQSLVDSLAKENLFIISSYNRNIKVVLK